MRGHVCLLAFEIWTSKPLAFLPLLFLRPRKQKTRSPKTKSPKDRTKESCWGRFCLSLAVLMKILSCIGGLIWKVWLLNIMIILTIKYVVFMYDRYIRATTLTTSMYPCVSRSSSFANFVNLHGNCISPLVTINLIKYARLGGHSQFVSDPLVRIFSHCSNIKIPKSASQAELG